MDWRFQSIFYYEDFCEIIRLAICEIIRLANGLGNIAETYISYCSIVKICSPGTC